jgi:hypothetical protein
MIKPNELRIGNWIEIRNEKMLPYYYPVSGHDISTIDDYGEGFEGGNYPIPLTPELLEKCGFKHHHSSAYYTLGKFEIYEENGAFYYDLFRMRVVKIAYLHKLQNLYFELYDKELEIKL